MEHAFIVCLCVLLQPGRLGGRRAERGQVLSMVSSKQPKLGLTQERFCQNTPPATMEANVILMFYSTQQCILSGNDRLHPHYKSIEGYLAII